MAMMATVPVGRVGVTIDAVPAIMPVNFAVAADGVVFRTIPGTKLDAATARKVVAFEADAFDPDGGWGWSVLIQGLASEIVDDVRLAEVRALPLRVWALPDGAAGRYVLIDAEFVSGQQFGIRPARP
jgi:nitroimidazol reductase NimA-like FMN-containing flavoprotein (pyridoxamine 5'-phosphate oxidase superfamily)